MLSFQSTHPHGVRRRPRKKTYSICCSFNPRTHTGCDLMVLLPMILCSWFQSTHPHGVRPLLCPNMTVSVLFQSTHPHGVRRCLSALCERASSFNPRTHTGCDICAVKHKVIHNVSIHAPTRGATLQIYPKKVCRKRFNPRTHTGCDLQAEGMGYDNKQFQSTHPHGVRPAYQVGLRYQQHVSIHAPTRGATTPLEQ